MQFHWCLSWFFSWMHVVGQMHVNGQRKFCITCIRPYVLAFSPGNFSMKVEQVGVSMEDISFLAWTRWSSSWGIISYQLVCWTGESSHTFLWRGVGKLQCCQCPTSYWHWNFHWSMHFQQQLKFLVCPPVHHSVFWPLLTILLSTAHFFYPFS